MFYKNFKPFFYPTPQPGVDVDPGVAVVDPGESETGETLDTEETVTESLEPRSRSEKMYAKMTGDPAFQNFKPYSRRERFLDKLHENGSGGGSPMISITYQELVALRSGSQLVPGMQYRITDYVCTVANDTEARAVSHPYDIIVTADDASTLNENARACLHDGDTYYSAQGAQADLTAWELKYCLDNDTNRFAWADSTNGKGVVFWLKDDWNNECPYDFKQIQFKRYKITACAKSPGLVGTYLATPEISNVITKDSTDFIWAYTFSGGLNESIIDTSVYNWVYSGREGYLHCYDNAIKTFADASGVIRLNNIVFLASGIPCYSNTFGNNCSSNTFGNNCESNTFGNNCSSNTFGDSCRSNTFGNTCRLNTFGNNCESNTFGNNCSSNTFGNNCSSNTFGNNCSSNTFGNNNCSSNTFGNNCESNTFGNDCLFNTFGNYCGLNTFGNNNCSSNTFGDSCRSNTFGNTCRLNTFGNNCSSNTFGIDCGSNTFGNDCRSNTFGDYCGSNTFGNTCRSNTFGDSFGSNTFGNNCAFNTFGNDCRSNTFGNDAQGDEASAHCRWCTFEDGVKGVVLSNNTAMNANQIQNYHVLNGTQGVMKTGFVSDNPVQTPITIDASLGLSYCTYVGKNSSGAVKTWAPADLVQS